MTTTATAAAMTAAAMTTAGMTTAAAAMTTAGMTTTAAATTEATAAATTEAAAAATTTAKTTAAMIASATRTAEAMTAPAVAVAPVKPWAYTQEDAVVEIARSVKSVRRAVIRRVVIVAIFTNWRRTDFNANLWTADVNANANLRLGRWHKSQCRNQCSCAQETFKSTHFEPL
jgi:hypothetical protein